MFAYAAREHSQLYGTQPHHYAAIASKNRRQGAQNPRAAQQRPLTEKEVLSTRMLCEPITMAMAAMTGDGGAACLLCSQQFMKQKRLQVKEESVLTVCSAC